MHSPRPTLLLVLIDQCFWSNVVQMSPSIPPFDEFEARRCCRGPHDAFKWMLKMQTAPEDTAAIIIEPILGEGGFVAPPPDFLSTLRKHCDEHNIVMIVDEVGLHLVEWKSYITIGIAPSYHHVSNKQSLMA